MSREELENADRASLVSYLESWGFACFANESTEMLQTAALLNYDSEIALRACKRHGVFIDSVYTDLARRNDETDNSA